MAEGQEHQRDCESAQNSERVVDRRRQARAGAHQHEGDRNRIDDRRAGDVAEGDLALRHPDADGEAAIAALSAIAALDQGLGADERMAAIEDRLASIKPNGSARPEARP
jgi:hypothetical protein